ncbi:MAG: hypothetical protein P1S46_11570 [bacterium]|nr:hypothetical protein [bacterium]
MDTKNSPATTIFSLALGTLACALAAFPPQASAGPVNVEAMKLPQQAADPYAVQISLGPCHEYDPVYYAPGADTCPILAFRVLVLRYTRHDNLVIEELQFSGEGCRELQVRSSYSVNGVRLGYLLKEGSQFAQGLSFVRWESWDSCVIESRKKEFRLKLGRDGVITAEPAPRTEPAN